MFPGAAARARAPAARRARAGRPRAQDGLRDRARARDRPAARRGPARPLGREQSAADLARRTARAVGRSARALELLGRHRHAGGLLPVCARRRRARRRRPHRPRPLGHAPARRASRDVGRDPAPDPALPRARPLRDAARLRVDQLDPGPPPRAALRRRGEGALLARSGVRVARPALARARRTAGPHLRAPLGGRTDRHELGDPARSRPRARHRDRVRAREQRGSRLAACRSTTPSPATSCATPSGAATASASSEAATATTGIPAWRSSPPRTAASRRSSPRSARARACSPRCAPGASTPPTARGSCCARALGAHPMGSSITVGPGGSASETLFVSVISPQPLERVDLIRSGRVVDTIAARGRARRDARTPRRGPAARRVRLRSRRAARRRRRLVEPDLRRVSRRRTRPSPARSNPMRAAPRISVLLPVWNAAATLPACLASLRRQTETSWECALVDDGSTRREPRDRARLRRPRRAPARARPPAPRPRRRAERRARATAAAASSRAWTPTT